jgi:hypothetical protein
MKFRIFGTILTLVILGVVFVLTQEIGNQGTGHPVPTLGESAPTLAPLNIN